MAGTERKAEADVWLGGIVGYGYRKNGVKGESRLVISEEVLGGQGASAFDTRPARTS